MRYLKKSKIRLSLLGLLVIFILVYINLDYPYENDYLIDEKTPEVKKADYWDLTGSNVIIDDNDPLYNWAITAATKDWCSGSGTLNDPYIIENVTIDGQSSRICIHILNSDVYFIIKNCTLYNAQYGIVFEFVKNGKVLNNTCSYNSNSGISLGSGENNIIEQNVINNNGNKGIWVGSNKNTIIRNNKVGFNGGGDSLDGGIFLSKCEGNIVKENFIYNNTYNGISFYDKSDNNYIIMNLIHNNSYGIKMHTQLCDSNRFIKNNISHGDYGIYLRSSTSRISNQYNTFFKNYVVDNNLYGIYIQNSQQNHIYFNNFSRNSINAYDSGSGNIWDYGFVGNYWDDYDGIDANDDGIGDTPYNIPGSAQNKDYHPVLDFDKVIFYDPVLIFFIVICIVFIFALTILIFRKKITNIKLFYLKKRKSLQRK